MTLFIGVLSRPHRTSVAYCYRRSNVVCLCAVVKVDRRIRWHYTTTILRLRIGVRLTRYRNCKFHNGCRTISRHTDGISRYSVPPSAGPLLPLPVCPPFLCWSRPWALQNGWTDREAVWGGSRLARVKAWTPGIQLAMTCILACRGPWLKDHVLNCVHIGATWRRQQNDPCAAAVRPCVKLLWSLVLFFLSCVSVCFTLIINLCFSCTSQPPRSALLLIPPLSYQLRWLHSLYCNQSSIYLSTSAAAELVSVDDSQGNDAAWPIEQRHCWWPWVTAGVFMYTALFEWKGSMYDDCNLLNKSQWHMGHGLARAHPALTKAGLGIFIN